jgi:hypothetical protein
LLVVAVAVVVVKVVLEEVVKVLQKAKGKEEEGDKL